MRHKLKFGKVVKNHLGYNIRQMVNIVTNEQTKKVQGVPTGKFGLYAGKKLISEYKKIDDAVKYIDDLKK